MRQIHLVLCLCLTFISLIWATPRLEKVTTKYIAPDIADENQQPYDYQDGNVPPPVTTELPGASRRSDSSIGPLDERSLKDCKLIDLLIVSDIDGNLHGVARNSGELLWSLPIDEPLVRIQSNTSSDNPQSNILWFVEPYQDGSLYYFTPKFGLNKLPTSIKDLVMESPFSLSGDDKIYTGTRRTSLYSINIHTGEIINSFGSEDKCPVPNTHYKIDAHLYGDQDTIMVGKTTFELSIHTKLNKNVVWNVTYSQWGPNKIDNDLIMQNSQSLDKLYFTPYHDKSLMAINKDISTLKWVTDLPSSAVNVFDVFNNMKDSGYVLLPHPIQVLNEASLQTHEQTDRNEFVFIDKTANGKEWYAMSFNNYPTMLVSAPLSKYQSKLNLMNHMSIDTEYLKNFRLLTTDAAEVEDLIRGIHRVFDLTSDTQYQPVSRFDITRNEDIKRIDGGESAPVEVTEEEKQEEIVPNIINGIKFTNGAAGAGDLALLDSPYEDAVSTSTYEAYQPYSNPNTNPSTSNNISTSSIAKRIIEDLVVLLILFILLMTFGKSSKFVQTYLSQGKIGGEDQESFLNEVIAEKSVESVEDATRIADASEKIKNEDVVTKNFEVSNSDSVYEDGKEPEKLKKKVEFVSPIGSQDSDNSPADTTSNDKIEELDDVEDDGDNNEEVTTKKKRKRGSRGGKRGGRRINKSKDDTSSPEEGDLNNNEVSPEEEIISTKSLIKSTPLPMKIPIKKLQIENNLVISDKILGYGSHGTIVYQGTFENRPVAVKRMLLDFFDVANHEVRLLQESDDHPNVIRYFCSQSSESEKFLYIALELCLCSLEDIIEKPKKSPKLNIPKINDVLHQLVSGLHYLHSLKIVHRDLKPQNILVADIRKNSTAKQPSQINPSENNVRLLISDFGLCKKLDSDQSSFRATTQHAASGTSGWRAPELLLHHDLLEISPDTISSVGSNSRHSINDSTMSTTSSPTAATGKRLTKAIDIFSLGCVFYYILTGGNHPFGDRYMREGNIIKGEYDISLLLQRCPNDKYEATDLIASMIHASPSQRPSTSKILNHPLFWSTSKRLEFLLKVSDRFEIERRDPPSDLLLELEACGDAVHQGNWHKKFDSEFMDNLGKYRKYQPEKLMDLLRALRNKYHHFNDMPDTLQSQMSPLPSGFYKYFNDKFPNLLMEVYFLVEKNLSEEHVFRDYY
ncbi:uncharacterized protein RJT20DRAFT_126815 [Scheffersomyces xylosifermentans]|uniref:uncharacterized protein n=1 Tax=Scheffersomyces xylosifermentans TaxID=1304137 RepID=UPI00315CC6EF